VPTRDEELSNPMDSSEREPHDVRVSIHFSGPQRPGVQGLARLDRGARPGDYWTTPFGGGYARSMLTTAVIPSRDLRNHTAEVLRRVEAGEELEILHNNRPVARLVPLRARR
jgi:prevent-host-death family protein